MSLLGLQQPMAAQVAAAAMVTCRWESRREYTAHSGISDPSSTRYSLKIKHAQMLTHVAIIPQLYILEVALCSTLPLVLKHVTPSNQNEVGKRN